MADAAANLRAHKRIRVRPQRPTEALEIERDLGLSTVAARVLAARGYSAGSEVRNYITPTLKDGLPDPSELLNLFDACNLIAEFVNAGAGIAVCCDFDVDGLSGGAIVHHFLQRLGVRSRVFVPNRFVEGYGLNEDMVRTAAAEEYGLIICVDYGTTNVKELELARELGLKSIVVDHHHVAANPPADVFVNPKQEGCGFADCTLCAAGLAWYLTIGLRRTLPQAADIDVRSYLDLACLGTICDMVPLKGANRVIAKRGLAVLTKTQRVGLLALKNVIGIRGEVSGTNVSFGIGPRINAAGRMVHGEIVIELLTTSNSVRAGKLAEKLNRLNLQRQDIEAQIKKLAAKAVLEGGSRPWGIVVWDKDFHTGVIGIVAQRLVELFYRPTAVLGADGDVYKGSVRGIKGFSVIDALDACSQHLLKFGGHDGAGGFSVTPDDLPKFAAAFQQECQARLQEIETEPYSDADTQIELPELSFSLVDELNGFAPFGIGNPGPVLLVKGLTVREVKVLKGQHLRVTLSDGSRQVKGLMWQQASHPALNVGGQVDVACRPGVNVYQGNSELQITIQAVEPSGSAEC